MATPVLLADPHKDVAPHTYVIQVQTSKCLNCSHEGRSCEVFAKTFFKAQWERKYVHNFRPMRGEKPRYNLPIQIIHAPLITVPFCHECPSPSTTLIGLPYPPADTPTTSVITGASFSDTPETKPKKHKPTTTTDDLMEGLDL
jgi:hypothetical protein